MRTGCSNPNEAMNIFHNAVHLLQLIEEQAEQLALSMLGEVNREEQVGVRYR